jgi:hypothetical protein
MTNILACSLAKHAAQLAEQQFGFALVRNFVRHVVQGRDAAPVERELLQQQLASSVPARIARAVRRIARRRRKASTS